MIISSMISYHEFLNNFVEKTKEFKLEEVIDYIHNSEYDVKNVLVDLKILEHLTDEEFDKLFQFFNKQDDIK